MTDIHPNEAAIIEQASDASDAVPVRLVIDINVTNERLLRAIAADRMARGGFGGDPAEHESGPLHQLVYEAMFGSNPDPLSPVEMGFEVVSIA